MVPSWLLDEVAKQLESQAERQQIHQLAFAANRHCWPSDPNSLDLYRLRDLVQDLTRSYASFEELKQALRLALAQAPQPKALIPAARTLLQVIRQAYQGDGSAAALPSEASLDGFQVSGESKAQNASPFETRVSSSGDRKDNRLGSDRSSTYEDIAAILQQSPSATRVKKLLYAVCSGEWSNDPVMLGRFRLSNLLKQLHQMSADEEALRCTLRGVVVTLNRQMEYELVAQLIQRECHQLYASPADHANHSLGGQSLAVASATVRRTAYIEDDFSAESDSFPSTGVEPIPLGFYDDDDICESTGSRLPARSPAESSNSLQNGAVLQAVAQVGEAAPGSTVHQAELAIAEDLELARQPRTLDWEGLAELRVELMCYANPLRVKTLLFSTLYFQFDPKADADWSKLQGETLGNLIIKLMEQFTSHSRLNEQLQITANQLMPGGAYRNAAGAIARALRPFYP